MLNIWLLFIIGRWIMVWNKAVFCMEVVIYKRLQIWRRHYDVISRNEYLICTLSESTVPQVFSLQFLFEFTHHSWRYKRNCEWVFFFWTQCIKLNNINLNRGWCRKKWHQVGIRCWCNVHSYNISRQCSTFSELPCIIITWFPFVVFWCFYWTASLLL